MLPVINGLHGEGEGGRAGRVRHGGLVREGGYGMEGGEEGGKFLESVVHIGDGRER